MYVEIPLRVQGGVFKCAAQRLEQSTPCMKQRACINTSVCTNRVSLVPRLSVYQKRHWYMEHAGLYLIDIAVWYTKISFELLTRGVDVVSYRFMSCQNVIIVSLMIFVACAGPMSKLACSLSSAVKA